METKNLLNKKITQWLLLVAMLVGCSACAWADAIPSGTTIFLDFTNCDFTTNGYSSGVYVSVVGSGNAGKVANKSNTNGAASYAPKSESKWYTASKVGTSKIYKFTTTQEIGSNGFSVWSKNASNYDNCWEMNVRLCITDYNGANCYQFESGCTNHGDRRTNCYSGSWKKCVTGTIYYDNTNTKFSTCYNYIGRGNYTKCYTMERVSGTQYLWKKKYDFVDFTMWYVSSEHWWDEKNDEDVYKYGYHKTKTVTMKYESPWTDGEVYKASSTLDNITDYSQSIQGYKWDSPAHSTVSNYTVTISNGTGGTTTVTDYDDAAVSSGASKIYLTVLKITVTPNSGYNIKKVTVGGTDYTSSAESGEFTYTVKAATTISVTYEKACATPEQQTVSIGAATICSSSSTTISTTTSQSSYKYQLAKQNGSSWDNVGTAVNGGSALSFTNISTAGTYKIYGYLSTDETCKADMKNTVALSVDVAPAAGTVSGGKTICSGSSASLSRSNQTGTVDWEKSTTSSTSGFSSLSSAATSYTATAAGWYRVKVSSGVCTPVYATATQVQVDAKSSVGTITITGSNPICEGSTTTLKVGTCVGDKKWQIYSGSSWSDVGSTDDTYITGALTSNTRYRVYAKNGVCGEATKEATTITVNKTTVAGSITGAGDICNGGTKTLSSSGATATNYKWKSCSTESGTYVDASGTINVSTYSAQPTESTYYKLAVKNGACEWAYTDPVRVVVNNKPAQPGSITSSVTAPCVKTAGLTYSISDVATATSYTWTVPTGWSITAGGTTRSMTATAGTAGGDIKVKANNDCGSSVEQTLAVTVKPAPNVSATPNNTTAYEVITLESTSGSVLWSKDAADTKAYFVNDNQAVDGDTVDAVSVNFKAPAKVGSYTVTAKGSNDCTSNISITIGTAQEVCN